MSDEGQEQLAKKQGRRWVIPTAIGVFVAGLVLTGATAFIEHSFWLSSVCVNVGTTLLLAAPLAWLAHHLTEQIQSSREVTERQISEVKTEVDGVQADFEAFQESTDKKLADLQSAYRAAADESLNSDAQTVEELASNPGSFELAKAIESRIESGQIAEEGLIVEYHESRLYARVLPSGALLQVSAFEAEVFLQEFEETTMKGDDLARLLLSLNKKLAGRNLIRIDEFNTEQFVSNTIEALHTIDECLDNHYPNSIGAVVAVPNNHWLLTERGMVAVKHPYPLIGYRQEAPEDRGWLDTLSEQPWYDKNAAFEAFEFASRMKGLARSWAHGGEITQRNQLRPPKDFRPRFG